MPEPSGPSLSPALIGPQSTGPAPGLMGKLRQGRLLCFVLCSSGGGCPGVAPPVFTSMVLPGGGELGVPRGPGLVSVAVPGRQMNKNSPIWLSHRPLFWEAGPPLPASRDAAPRHAEVSAGPRWPSWLSWPGCLQLLLSCCLWGPGGAWNTCSAASHCSFLEQYFYPGPPAPLTKRPCSGSWGAGSVQPLPADWHTLSSLWVEMLPCNPRKGPLNPIFLLQPEVSGQTRNLLRGPVK